MQNDKPVTTRQWNGPLVSKEWNEAFVREQFKMKPETTEQWRGAGLEGSIPSPATSSQTTNLTDRELVNKVREEFPFLRGETLHDDHWKVLMHELANRLDCAIKEK